MRGGYKLIDFKNVEFDETTTTIIVKNILNDIINSHKKMTVIHGFNYDGVEYSDTPITFLPVVLEGAVVGAQGIALIGGELFQIIVNNSDQITVVPVDLRPEESGESESNN